MSQRMFEWLWAVLSLLLLFGYVNEAKAQSFLARDVYTSTGTTGPYSITFTVQGAASLEVLDNGALYTGGFTLTTPSTLVTATPITSGHQVSIIRLTPIASPSATFNGGALRSADLNNNVIQALQAIQEIDDNVTVANTNIATALTNAASATTTANAASTAATSAVTTANAVSGIATGAQTTANSAQALATNIVHFPINVRLAFSAVGDGYADDTNAIQNAINAACTAGHGTVYIPGGFYLVRTNVLNVTCSDVGIVGDGSETTTIETTNPSGNILSFTGTSSVALQHPYLRNISVGREVSPTIGNNNCSVCTYYTTWFQATDVFAYNSVTQFWLAGDNASSLYRTLAFRTTSYQGAGDTFTGYRLTGSSTLTDVKRFDQAYAFPLAGNGVSWGGTSYGFWDDEADTRNFLCVSCLADASTYGYYFDGSNSGTNTQGDIRLVGSSADGYSTAGVYLVNQTAVGLISISGGWFAPGYMEAGTNYIVYGTNVVNVDVVGNQALGLQTYSNAQGFYFTHSSNVQINSNSIRDFKTLAYLDSSGGNVSNFTINANSDFIDTSTSGGAIGVYLNGSSNGSVAGNTFNGGGASLYSYGIEGAGTTANIATSLNTFNGSAVPSNKVAGLTGTGDVAEHNPGYNPIGVYTPGTAIACGTPWVNASGVDTQVTLAGGTVTNIAVQGLATGLTSGAFLVPAGGQLTVTCSVLPTTITYQGY